MGKARISTLLLSAGPMRPLSGAAERSAMEEYFMLSQKLSAQVEEKDREIFRLRMSLAMAQEWIEGLTVKLGQAERFLNPGKFMEGADGNQGLQHLKTPEISD